MARAINVYEGEMTNRAGGRDLRHAVQSAVRVNEDVQPPNPWLV